MIKKILVADDEIETLQLLERKLSAAGYEVVKAISGQEAITRIKKFLPNLILMDIVLPDIDGSEVIKTIKDDPLTQHIPVIFLSGIVTRGDDHAKLEVKVGSRLYPAIPKPFQIEQLLSEIRKIL